MGLWVSEAERGAGCRSTLCMENEHRLEKLSEGKDDSFISTVWAQGGDSVLMND